MDLNEKRHRSHRRLLLVASSLLAVVGVTTICVINSILPSRPIERSEVIGTWDVDGADRDVVRFLADGTAVLRGFRVCEYDGAGNFSTLREIDEVGKWYVSNAWPPSVNIQMSSPSMEGQELTVQLLSARSLLGLKLYSTCNIDTSAGTQTYIRE